MSGNHRRRAIKRRRHSRGWRRSKFTLQGRRQRKFPLQRGLLRFQQQSVALERRDISGRLDDFVWILKDLSRRANDFAPRRESSPPILLRDQKVWSGRKRFCQKR